NAKILSSSLLGHFRCSNGKDTLPQWWSPRAVSHEPHELTHSRAGSSPVMLVYVFVVRRKCWSLDALRQRVTPDTRLKSCESIPESCVRAAERGGPAEWH